MKVPLGVKPWFVQGDLAVVPQQVTDTDADQPGLSVSGGRHQHLLCLCCSDSWERGQQLFFQFL